MNWVELEERINDCTRRIWLDEPKDLKRLRMGVVDSGAGSHGQYFSTLLFAQSEIRGLALHSCAGVLVLAQDEGFSLEQLRQMARVLFAGRAGFLNYVGLHELGGLFNEYFEVLESIETREQFIRLTRALKAYGARLWLWSEHVFPWGVGIHLQQKSEGEARELLSEVDRGPWQRVPYLVR